MGAGRVEGRVGEVGAESVQEMVAGAVEGVLVGGGVAEGGDEEFAGDGGGLCDFFGGGGGRRGGWRGHVSRDGGQVRKRMNDRCCFCGVV